MGIYPQQKDRIDNPLKKLDTKSITDVYDSLIVAQADVLLKIFSKHIAEDKKIYKIFSFFDKDDICIRMPMKIFDENLVELRSKGFRIRKNKNEKNEDDDDFDFVAESNEYIYKFVWSNRKYGY